VEQVVEKEGEDDVEEKIISQDEETLRVIKQKRKIKKGAEKEVIIKLLSHMNIYLMFMKTTYNYQILQDYY